MGYHSSKVVSIDDLSRIEYLIKTCSLAADVRRLHCVYLRCHFGYSAEKIAKFTQFSTGHVRRSWRAYFKEGIDALLTKPRGGIDIVFWMNPRSRPYSNNLPKQAARV